MQLTTNCKTCDDIGSVFIEGYPEDCPDCVSCWCCGTGGCSIGEDANECDECKIINKEHDEWLKERV